MPETDTESVTDGACSMCGHAGTLQLIEGLPVCYDCIRDSGMFTRCTVCGSWRITERVLTTADGHKVCRDCAELNGRSIQTWATLNHEEAIGIEVEAFPARRDDGDRYLSEVIRRHPEMARKFTLAHDGSVTGGEELVSAPIPLVMAPEFFASIGWMARELKVDSTCGLHVHVNCKQWVKTRGDDANTMSEIGVAFQRLALGFMKVEQFMFDCQPRSRRNGHFCQPLSARFGSKTYSDLRNMKPADVVKLWYTRGYGVGPRHRREISTDKYHDSRYTWVNLHSLMVKNTTEIRLHSGTTNPMKMRLWSSICAKLVKHFMTARMEDIDAFDVDQMKLLLSRVEWEYLAARKAKFGVPPAPIDESRMNIAGGISRSG